MITLKDENKQTINKWQYSHNTNIIFKVHQKQLVDVYEDADDIIVFYGYLDQETNGLSNAQFVHSQLEAAGINGLNNCYGSFIVLIYQQEQDLITLANDALGDFAVNYTYHANVLHVSDFPKALLQKNKVEINNERVLHFFAMTQPQKNGCFFKDINQLNPGEYFQLKQAKININQYYLPPTKVNYKTKSVSKLSRQYKDLIQQVIAHQAKGENKVGLMMSGGLDSTFVAANTLAIKKQLFSYSYVFPNMPQANESIWIDSMRSMDIQMHTFSGENYWPLKSPWHISKNSPLSNPYRLMKDVIYHQAERKKIKILLSGVFADHLYTGYIYAMVEKLKKRPFKAIKDMIKTTKKNGVIAGLKQLSPGKWRKTPKINAPWLTQDAQQAIKDKIKKRPKNKLARPEQHALTFGISTAQSSWLDNEYAFKSNLNVRHTYRDRRIVEFLLSIPSWVLGDIDNPKKFARRTSKDMLPASIIRRQKITSLKPLFVKGVMEKEIEKVKGLLNASTCKWQNFVKKDLIQNMLNKPKANHSDGDYMILWLCISFELWRKAIKD